MDQFKPNQESASFKLPEVQTEESVQTPVFESGAKNINESSMSKAVEQNSMVSSLSDANTQAHTQPLIDPLKNIQSTKDQPTTTTHKIVVTDSLPANDIDLIEKAWVVKAKSIVDQTKNDPYEQSNELTKIRTDYQKKRFNINLKSDKE